MVKNTIHLEKTPDPNTQKNLNMSADGEYTVEYVDDRPEELKFLKRDGMVKITYVNGDLYEGPIGRDRLKQGNGKYTWRTKGDDDEFKEIATYEGNYENGVKTGIGKMKFPNGDVYHGEWRQDKMNGEGSFLYANGDIFSGHFENGIRFGTGTYEFAYDKSLLVGTWKDNTILEGKWIFKSGGFYSGHFENGLPIGGCMLKFPNGLQQDGEYVKVQETNAAGEQVAVHKFMGGPIIKA